MLNVNDKLLINLFLQKKLSKALPNRTMNKRIKYWDIKYKMNAILKMIDRKKKRKKKCSSYMSVNTQEKGTKT